MLIVCRDLKKRHFLHLGIASLFCATAMSSMHCSPCGLRMFSGQCGVVQPHKTTGKQDRRWSCSAPRYLKAHLAASRYPPLTHCSAPVPSALTAGHLGYSHTLINKSCLPISDGCVLKQKMCVWGVWVWGGGGNQCFLLLPLFFLQTNVLSIHLPRSHLHSRDVR